MVIYWDIVFLLNIFMNFIILWLTSVTTKNTINFIRLCVGAIAGSVFLLALFFPTLHFLFSLTMKFLLSLFIVIITFLPSGLKELIKLILHFYIISFVIGGAAFGVFYFADIGVNFYNGILVINDKIVPWWVLLVSILLGIVLINLFSKYMQKKYFNEKMFAVIKIFLCDTSLEVKALIDTGNNLYDPLSDTPVIVVEYEAVKKVLAKEFQDIFEEKQEVNLHVLSEKLINSQWSTRLRIIPYSSIGLTNGILVGFKPDKIIITTNEEKLEITESIIGICNNTLSPDGNYKALLNPDFLKS